MSPWLSDLLALSGCSVVGLLAVGGGVIFAAQLRRETLRQRSEQSAEDPS